MPRTQHVVMARPTLAVIVTIVWGLLALPGLLAAALSPMFFDAPGSVNNPAAWFNALVIVSFPVLCVLSIGGTWVLWFARRSHPGSRSAAAGQIVLACLPLVPVAYVVAASVVETAGVIFSGQPMGLHSTIIRQ